MLKRRCVFASDSSTCNSSKQVTLLVFLFVFNFVRICFILSFSVNYPPVTFRSMFVRLPACLSLYLIPYLPILSVFFFYLFSHLPNYVSIYPVVSPFESLSPSHSSLYFSLARSLAPFSPLSFCISVACIVLILKQFKNIY